jgi:Flp pilus assembly protein TadG
MLRLRILHRRAVSLLKDEQGAALLEFAIALPLLVVFVVGIYDFSGAANQKQKIEQAAQEGAIIAGAQPTSDFVPLDPGTAGPYSLRTVATAVFNSLVGSGVLPTGTCSAPGTAAAGAGLTWIYTISGCDSAGDALVITVNRGWVCPAPCTGPAIAVGTSVMVKYPYHWRFNSVIQLLIPGASYAAITQLTETATAHNQM